MPPKGRGSGARGRGRGRGKATATSAPDPEGAPNDEPGSQSTDTTVENESAELPHPTPKAVTPQHLNDPPSPNSSPATVPTETPAPTPARIIPPPKNSPASSSTSLRGGRGGRAGAQGSEKPAGPSRFKPKAVRRDDSEREELARKEQARIDSINANNARQQARFMRGRGGWGRGRGDGMGMGRGRLGTASGVFGVAPEGLKNSAGHITIRREGGGSSGTARSGGGYSSATHSGGGRSGGGGGGGGSMRGFVDNPEYPGEDSSTPRVNIEEISKQIDDDVIVTGSRRIPNRNGKGVVLNGGFAPVRLERVEHKERVTIVNTGMGVKSEDQDSPTIDEKRSSVAKPRGKGAEDDNDVKVKTEDEDVGMAESHRLVSPAPGASSIKSSPDSKRAAKEAIGASISGAQFDLTSTGSPAPISDEAHATIEKKAQRHSSKREKKPVFQTEEDKEEWDRYQEDMSILRDELGGLQTASGSTTAGATATDADGDIQMDETAPIDSKVGRLYLFQFPPVLPVLYDPSKSEKPNTKDQAEKEKAEKGKGKGKEKDISLTDTNSGKPKAKANIDLTVDETSIKVEEEVEITDKDKRPEEKKREPVVDQEGYVGKLNIYESGRVELDWGGTKMLLGKGVGSKFLSTGVIVDSREVGPPGGGPPEGKAYGMGPIMGKFVLTPDWESIFK